MACDYQLPELETWLKEVSLHSYYAHGNNHEHLVALASAIVRTFAVILGSDPSAQQAFEVLWDSLLGEKGFSAKMAPMTKFMEPARVGDACEEAARHLAWYILRKDFPNLR
jgi:hypothetical protein